MEILLTGNAADLAPLIAKSLVMNRQKVFVSCPGLIKKHLPGTAKVYSVTAMDDLYPELFKAADFDVVVFFASRGEQMASRLAGGLESLKTTLSLCLTHGVKRVVYVSSTEVCDDEESEEAPADAPNSLHGMMLGTGEKMCELHGRVTETETFILRLPFLYGESLLDSAVGRAVRQAADGETVRLPGGKYQKCDFLHISDGAALLCRMIEDKVICRACIVHAAGSRPVTFRAIAAVLQARFPRCSVECATDVDMVPIPVKGVNARKYFDWTPVHDIMHDLPGLLASAAKSGEGRRSFFAKIGKILSKRSWVVWVAEDISLFFLVSYLAPVLSGSPQFRYIDARLLYVVIMGSMHGFRAGLLAAALACLSLLLSYQAFELDWRTMLYNVDNWFPFLLYFMAGAVTGYNRDKSDGELKFEKQKLESMESKTEFLTGLCRQTMEQKDEYRAQLLSYRDSFGKVYAIARSLDSMVADEVLKNAVSVLEETMQSTNVVIYTIDNSFARLEACSANIAQKSERSVALGKYPEMFGALQKDRVWVNRNMLDGYPFYCVPIYRQESLIAAVTVQDVPFGQMSASGSNLLLVVCGLIQASLIRAITYTRDAEAKHCMKGTHILTPERFAEVLRTRTEMKELNMADHVLLLVDEQAELTALSQRIEQVVRKADVVGQGEDGRIYIILKQSTVTGVKQIINRLASNGIRCSLTNHLSRAKAKPAPVSEAI